MASRSRVRPAKLAVIAGCLLAGALALGGCKTKTPIAPTAYMQSDGSFFIETRTGLTVTTALPNLLVRLLPDAAALADTPTGLPDFVSKFMTIYSPTRLKDPRVLSSEAGDATQVGRLPAMDDVSVYAFLRDGAGRLTGSGVVHNASFRYDVSEIPVPISANRERPRLVSASDDVSVTDGVVLKSLTLELTSGMPNHQPGIDRVEIEISGAAYGDGQEVGLIASFKAPDVFNYAWRPQLSSGTYEAAKLKETNDPLPFTLTTRAYDPFGNLVGVDTLALKLVGEAYVDVGIDNVNLQ